jgi:hypothetical protein
MLWEVDYGTNAAADGVFGSVTVAAEVPEPTSLLLLVTGRLLSVKILDRPPSEGHIFRVRQP